MPLSQRQYEERLQKRLLRRGRPIGTMPAMQVGIDFPGAGMRRAVLRDGDTFIQSASLDLMSTKQGLVLDYREMREAFAEVRSRDQLEIFLSYCGPFRDDSLEQRIAWPEFEMWKVFVKDIWLGKRPSVWPGAVSFDYDSIIEPRLDLGTHTHKSGSPEDHWMIHCKTTLSVIGATIFVDRRNNAKFEVCRLGTCNKPFRRESAHERNFCSPEHRRQFSKKNRDLEGTNGKA